MSALNNKQYPLSKFLQINRQHLIVKAELKLFNLCSPFNSSNNKNHKSNKFHQSNKFHPLDKSNHFISTNPQLMPFKTITKLKLLIFSLRASIVKLMKIQTKHLNTQLTPIATPEMSQIPILLMSLMSESTLLEPISTNMKAITVVQINNPASITKPLITTKQIISTKLATTILPRISPLKIMNKPAAIITSNKNTHQEVIKMSAQKMESHHQPFSLN